MTRRDYFVNKAINLGAAYLLAPEKTTDALTNLGTVEVAAAELKNGAVLASPGLIDGGVAASLDGTNDYIDTGWETRTNLEPNPTLAAGGVNWNTVAGVSLTHGSTMPDGTPAGKCEGTAEPGKGSNVSVFRSTGATELWSTAPGDTFNVAAEIWPVGEARTIKITHLFLNAAKETIKITEGTIVAAPADQKTRCTVSAVAPEETVYARCSIRATLDPLENGEVVYLGEVLAEVASSLGSYFPTPTQLESGLAGWSGTEHESASDIGPFARGTKRTFVGPYQRASDETVDIIFSNSESGNIARFYVNLSDDLAFNANHVSAVDVSWNGEGKGTGITQFVALAFDGPGDTVALYTDGSLVSEQEHASDFAGADSGTLRLGMDSGAEVSPFDGSLLPFAVFLGELTANDIARLYGAYAGTFAPVDKVRVRQGPRLDLHYEVETPNGRFYRWGQDEPKPENVPSGGNFSTTDKGGFDSLNVTLPRKSQVSYADLGRLSTIRARGAGGEIASENRLKEAPRVSGNEMSVGPVTEGWIAHLGDDPTAAEIYIDRDLTNWGDPSTERLIQLSEAAIKLMASTSVGHSSLDPEAAAIALLNNFDNVTTVATDTEAGEAHYTSGVADIGEVLYDTLGDVAGGEASADWESNMSLGTTDTFTTAETGTDHDAGAATNQSVAAPAAGYKFARIRNRLNAVSEGVDLKRIFAWTNIAAVGLHELTRQGKGHEAGYLASDILADAIERWAPLLNLTTGSDGTIRPSTFVVPHLAFREQTTALAMLDEVNRYELRPYGVWENRTFHYHEWGERGRKWRARVAPTELSETGDSTERLRNGVVLRFQDVDGTTRTAGPIGSDCDIEDEGLEDGDPENPANQLGIKLYGPPFDLSIVTVDSEAVRVGELLLARLKETTTAGEAKIVGTCIDDRGIIRPAWQVRAGDTISFIDASDTSERHIIKTSYDDSTKTNSITLDAPPDGVDDLLAQLGVSTTDLGV